MSTYYVDADSASEAAPYDTQAKGAHTLATILAIPPSAGDVIYCCAGASVGETTAAELACASSGTNAGGWIKVIGCNASGTVDGTRYIIDANNGDFNVFNFAGYDMWWLENIQVQNNGGTTKHGFYSSASNSDGHVFINCAASDCTGSGFSTDNIRFSYFIRCFSSLNTSHGFACGGTRDLFLFCMAQNNSTDGFSNINFYNSIIGCISYSNTDDGVNGVTGMHVMNCVIDSNDDDGLEVTAGTNLWGSLIIGNRITNHAGSGDIGFLTNTEPVVSGWNYLQDNDSHNIQKTAGNAADKPMYQFIPVAGQSSEGTIFADGVDTNDEDNADTDDGYVAATNFSTDYDEGNPVSIRRVAITIPSS